MISLLFWLLSAFFNACADAFENENFFESVFKKWDQKFWYKRESWKHAKKVFRYKIDGWHLAKSAWIICSMIAGIFYEPISAKLFEVPILNGLIDIFISGVVWIAAFNLFYHRLFQIK